MRNGQLKFELKLSCELALTCHMLKGLPDKNQFKTDMDSTHPVDVITAFKMGSNKPILFKV